MSIFRTGQNSKNTYGHLKGFGGYVVAPPSHHPAGGVYTWVIAPAGLNRGLALGGPLLSEVAPPYTIDFDATFYDRAS